MLTLHSHLQSTRRSRTYTIRKHRPNTTCNVSANVSADLCRFACKLISWLPSDRHCSH